MSLVRCARCESFYYRDSDHTGQCRYHSGQYRAWWSCCKEPLYSSRGCRAGVHVEDMGYTAMLDSYCPPAAQAPTTEQIAVEGPDGRIMAVAGLIITQQDSPAQPAIISSADGDVAAQARTTPSSTRAQQDGQDGRTVAVPYVIDSTDTWSSICLRHRMTSEELLRLNGLRHRRCRMGDVLLVWSERSDAEQNEEMRRQLVRQFRRLTGACASEALYYLEQHEFAIGDAIREREKDTAWERERAEVIDVIHRDEATAKAADARMTAEVEARRAAEHAESDAAAAPNALAKCLGAGMGCLAPPAHVPNPAVAVPVI